MVTRYRRGLWWLVACSFFLLVSSITLFHGSESDETIAPDINHNLSAIPYTSLLDISSDSYLHLYFDTLHDAVPAENDSSLYSVFSRNLWEQPPDSAASMSRSTELRGTLRKGDNLASSLSRLPISSNISQLIIDNLASLLDPKQLKPNDTYSIVLDEEGELQQCVYESGPLDVYELNRTEKGYETAKVPITLERKIEKVSGEITSSLYDAFLSAGELPPLIFAFADIFSAKIDFNTEIHKGDAFHLIVEKYYKENEFIRYGKILAAQYFQENKVIEGFLYDIKNHGAYYTRQGEELGASFIRSPLPVGKVTSGFTLNRKHPILGVTRPHLGIDLAAPTGTPIMAAADGKVIFAGWKNGFGKQVILEHKGSVKTYYGHLSRFHKGMKAGGRVKQKDIIGYVGSTGLSTGPHLDYRLSENGTYKNPFSLKFLPKSVLQGKQLALFKSNISPHIAFLEKRSSDAIMEVKNVTYSPDNPIVFL